MVSMSQLHRKQQHAGRAFAFFLGVLFLCMPEYFYGPDYAVYSAYIKSVVEDGDLNIVNNDNPGVPGQTCGQRLSGVEVTPAFNAPDFHNHGSILFWIPFYAYGKVVAKLAGSLEGEAASRDLENRIINQSLCLSTMALGYLSCVLIYLLAANFFGPRLGFWSLMAVFWGSPLFFYTICEPGNANIAALLFSSVIVITCASSFTARRRWPPLLFGMLVAIALAVKIDLWFVGIFIMGCYVLLWRKGQTSLATLGWFGLGLVGVGGMKPVNDYLKYGCGHLGEAGLINVHDSYHLEQLFSPYHGYFASSPLLLLCLLGMAVMGAHYLRQRMTGSPLPSASPGLFRLLVVMSCWLGVLIFVVGFRYAWGGNTFGARQLITFTPFFVLLMAYLMRLVDDSRRWWFRLAGAVVVVLLVGSNWQHAGEFLAEEPILYYLEKVSWLDAISHIGDVMQRLVEGLAAMPVKLLCLPLVGVTGWLGGKLVRQGEVVAAWLSPWDMATAVASPAGRTDGERGNRWLAVFTLVLVTGYALVTALNVINNRPHVAEMRANGCFENVRVLTLAEFEGDENATSMAEMIFYFWRKGDMEEVKRIKGLRERLYPNKTLDEFWWASEIP